MASSTALLVLGYARTTFLFHKLKMTDLSIGNIILRFLEGSLFIKVICRFKGITDHHKRHKNAKNIVKVSKCHKICKFKKQTFAFDYVFGAKSSQQQVFENGAKNLGTQLFDGYNVNLIGYGAADTGKTYSINGIFENILHQIFELIADATSEFLIQISYFEIYGGKIRDLLNPGNKKLKLRDHSKYGVYVEGITEMYICDAKEILDLKKMAMSSTTILQNGMNTSCQRSHHIFCLKLTNTNTVNGKRKVSQLKIFDLVSCRKMSYAFSTKQSKQEYIKIMQSLTSFRRIIEELSAGSHVSYRNSTLTRILSNAFNRKDCRTTLLLTCSSSSLDIKENIKTCKLGQHAHRIKQLYKHAFVYDQRNNLET